MDIDLLSKMVKELILDNDRVVLPGLGCFVAEMMPATFSDKGYTINPPYRKLFFRAKPDMDDMLVSFYASSNGLDHEVACRILGDFIAELRTVIFTKKTVIFPGLGRLRATKENNLFFIADEELDIYPAGFGLEPISLKTHLETEQEVSAAVVGLKSILDQTIQPQEPETAFNQNIVSESGTVPESETAPEPEAVPESEAVPEPEPDVATCQEHHDVSDSETACETESVYETESASGSDSECPEPVLSELAQPEEAGRPVWKRLLLVFGMVFAVILALLAAYVAVAHLAPEWIDSILYTPEELEILNRTL